MGYWGKVIGGMAGFAMGGPFGAVVGAALGHAADQGAVPNLRSLPQGMLGGLFNGLGGGPLGPARLAAMLGKREQLFAIAVVVLAAKLAKCDGPVSRAEIDAFKRSFRIPPESVRDIGRLFDEARDSPEGFASYADELGLAFADNLGVLEDVLMALFGIARADAPINRREIEFLQRVHTGFGLDPRSWERVNSGQSRFSQANEADPYAVLGVSRKAGDDELRAAWKKLMRDNHPDSLASRGVPAEFIARASEKVALINAAWDRIKRERGL
jgi:DnaJ like chaperone protein